MTGPAPAIAMLDVLQDVGFAAPADPTAGDLVLPVEGGGVAATHSPDLNDLDPIHLTGSVITDDAMNFIEDWLPRNVASREQGLAILAYYLKDRGIVPEPDFVKEGRQLQHLLPWRKNEQIEVTA